MPLTPDRSPEAEGLFIQPLPDRLAPTPADLATCTPLPRPLPGTPVVIAFAAISWLYPDNDERPLTRENTQILQVPLAADDSRALWADDGHVAVDFLAIDQDVAEGAYATWDLLLAHANAHGLAACAQPRQPDLMLPCGRRPRPQAVRPTRSGGSLMFRERRRVKRNAGRLRTFAAPAEPTLSERAAVQLARESGAEQMPGGYRYTAGIVFLDAVYGRDWPFQITTPLTPGRDLVALFVGDDADPTRGRRLRFDENALAQSVRAFPLPDEVGVPLHWRYRSRELWTGEDFHLTLGSAFKHAAAAPWYSDIAPGYREVAPEYADCWTRIISALRASRRECAPRRRGKRAAADG